MTICVGLDRPVLALLDPSTLETLAAMDLPPRMRGGNPFGDFTGGGYFYLDNHDRAVLPRPAPPAGRLDHQLRPTSRSTATTTSAAPIGSGDGIVSALPDWSGRIWFVTQGGGRDDRPAQAAGSARAACGEGISNSFAVDETGGVYIVSDQALYRFDASRRGGRR